MAVPRFVKQQPHDTPEPSRHTLHKRPVSAADPTIWRVHGSPLLAPTGSGPLDGLRVAVKDLIAVGGFAVGAGNPTWLAEASVQEADAPVVRMLRAAGAAIAGIVQTDELAFSLSGTNPHYGTPPNPAAPERVPGGSSSGPAAAVATGQAEIGLGTDTAGSIRVPASACGLYGFRPTHGAVAVEGVLPLAPSFDTVGWLTRDPKLLATVGEIVLPAGAPGQLPKRLFTPDEPDRSVRQLVDALGAELVVGSVPGLADVDSLLEAFRAVQAREAWQMHGAWLTRHPAAVAPDVLARFRAGAEIDVAAAAAESARIAVCRDMMLAALGEDGWLVIPAAGGPAHGRDATQDDRNEWRMATLRRTVVASAFGLPSCVVPTSGTPPIGLALVGPPDSDRTLLAVAAEAGQALSP